MVDDGCIAACALVLNYFTGHFSATKATVAHLGER